MSKDKPLISVIMGIYNNASTLSESIESLLCQTYKDFELIMCDDGSTDDTYTIAKKYADKYDNIVLLKNDSNKGLNYTLNYCLEYAQGKYIARQDSDDISIPCRFEKELDILESDERFAIVSSAMIHFNEKRDFKISKVIPYPKKIDFMYNSPFSHAASMIRKSVMLGVGGYSVSKYLMRVEDYHLWFKIYSKGYIGCNIQIPLYKWRDDLLAYRRRNFRNRLNEVYVRFIGFWMLKLPFYCYIYCLRPLIAYFTPRFLYNYVHKNINSE